jgi:hypothetical protein
VYAKLADLHQGFLHAPFDGVRVLGDRSARAKPNLFRNRQAHLSIFQQVKQMVSDVFIVYASEGLSNMRQNTDASTHVLLCEQQRASKSAQSYPHEEVTAHNV